MFEIICCSPDSRMESILLVLARLFMIIYFNFSGRALEAPPAVTALKNEVPDATKQN